MTIEDDAARPKSKPYTIGQDVSAFSIADLEETADKLKAELSRLEEIRLKKRASAAAADALFRKA